MAIVAWRSPGLEWLHPDVLINNNGELLSLVHIPKEFAHPAWTCARCGKTLQSGNGTDQFTPHLRITYFSTSRKYPWRCCLECWSTPRLEFQEGEVETENEKAESGPAVAPVAPTGLAGRYQPRIALKFLLVKADCFHQVWSDYDAYRRTSPSPDRTWSWRHFLTWAQTAYPGQVKASYDFLEVILGSEWILVNDVLIEAQDDPSGDPSPGR